MSVALHGSIIAALFVVAPPLVDGKSTVPDGPPITYVRPAKPVDPAPPRPAQPRAPSTPTMPTLPTLPTAPTINTPTTIPDGITASDPGPWIPPSPNGTPGGTGTDSTAGMGTPVGSGGIFTDAMVERPAELHQRSPLPQYPGALSNFRIDGGVRVRFVVDTLGRVEREGIEVLESSHPAFEAAVRATLPRMRFRPARVGGMAVRQLVEFPIAFKAAP